MLASAQDARADFRVCNGTQSLVGGAIGYRTAEGWVTEGWWQIPANSCATLIEGPLQSRYYYLYAEDAGGGGASSVVDLTGETPRLLRAGAVSADSGWAATGAWATGSG